MILPDRLGSVHQLLFEYFEDLDELHGEQIPSGESSLEVQLSARSKLKPHAPFLVRQELPDGRVTRVLWADNGIRQELVHVGQGDEFPEEPRTFRTHPEPQLQRPSLVGSALKQIGVGTPLASILESLARQFLTDQRYPFGRPFGWEDRQNRPLAPLTGVAAPPRRGAGTIAHLTPTAWRLWGEHAGEELDSIGASIGLHGRKGSEVERKLCRTITPEAGRLAVECLRVLEKVMHTTAERTPAALNGRRIRERRAGV